MAPASIPIEVDLVRADSRKYNELSGELVTATMCSSVVHGFVGTDHANAT